jgi:methyl-accepting chemotaxis protein
MYSRFIKSLGSLFVLGLVAAVPAGIAVGVFCKAGADRADALAAYRAAAHAETELSARTVAAAINQIYQRLRTISLFASVRNIDRHGRTLGAEGRQAIQQIHDNLKSDTDVREVYVVPVDLDPGAIDPVTGKKQEPILMFDTVQANIDLAPKSAAEDGGEPVQEIYEYRALQGLMGKLLAIVPNLPTPKIAEIPFFTLPSVITGVNTIYRTTHDDKDRTGPIYSVPFFAPDGKLKGTISAIMFDSSISSLLPEKNYALLDRTNGYVFGSPKGGQHVASAGKVAAGVADPNLLYSEVVPVPTMDPNKPFVLWHGLADAAFLTSPLVVQIAWFEQLGYGFAGLVALFEIAVGCQLRHSMKRAAREAHARRTAELEVIRRERLIVETTIGIGLARLADKDLAYRIKDDLPETYRTLQLDFNAALGRIEAAFRQVAATTQIVTSGARYIATGADDLSQRTAEQAVSLSQTAASLDDIIVTITRTAEGVVRARGVVAAAKSDAEESAEAFRKSSAAMREVEGSAQRIGQIVNVMEEITAQTNLLALNAGIEAVRAGAAGRGFAIVAHEIRALSDRSAGAANEIKTLIANSTRQVGEGARLMTKTGDALERILTHILKINTVMTEISEGAADQAMGLRQINAAMNELDEVTHRNAAIVEQSTAASHFLGDRTDELAQLLSRFKVSATSEPVEQTGARRFAEAA